MKSRPLPFERTNMKIIAYLKSTMRVATAIFLSILALTVVGGVAAVVYSGWEAAKVKKYEPIKEWFSDNKANLQFSVAAKTKLVDGRFFIQVETDAYPTYLNTPSKLFERLEQAITLNFLDSDGFKVYSKTITVGEFNRMIDQQGKPSGLQFEANELMDVQTYAAMAKLNLQWNVNTKDEGTSSANTDLRPSRVLDHCATKISKEERLRRLAQHGAVRETGISTYEAGGRSVTFLPHENTLLSCH